jgi:radical SAM superfamily enzyme YgiQ (UPF0313 family)
MRVKMILPALTEAHSSFWQPIKYSLFPPLGLATLAGHLPADAEVEIVDEHVESLDLDDRPDLVVIQAYVTSAYRAYEIADHYLRRGSYVCLGGLHVTARPREAMPHADSIFLGPGEDTWPQFIEDFRRGEPKPFYRSTCRTLEGMPLVRRDLIKRDLYLTPNTLVVSRGCPHACDFCYKENFYRGGRSYYHQRVDQVLAEIDRLPGRHLFFLDDNLFADTRFNRELFRAMKGMGRVWQAAGTVRDVLNGPVMEMAADCGLKSLFIGFESIRQANLDQYNKFHNHERDYERAIQRLHRLGVMINASFVFGMDHDDPDVFRQTVDWAISHGIETATFHILTPYPGTRLYERLSGENRILTDNWDLYDTRHAVFRPAGMTVTELEEGYRSAYREFYKWSSIFSSAWSHETFRQCVRHMAYTVGWKKFEPFWSWVIRTKQLRKMIPLLEAVLSAAGNKPRSALETGLARTVLESPGA